MKIKSTFKLFVLILLMLFFIWTFTSGKIYSASASELDVEIPEQNYDGISINSHIKNDFEYLGLDAPETYAKGDEKKIITIAEAVYRDDGELKKDVVVYYYHPSYKNQALPEVKLIINFNLLKRYELINGEYVQQLIIHSDLKEKEDSLYEVAHYNGIKKYTFSTKLNEYLITEPTNLETGKNTIFNINLDKTRYSNVYPYNGLTDIEPKKLYDQEFQFVSECTSSKTRSTSEPINTSLCVNYDINTVSVDGKAVKLRYKTSDVGNFKFISRAHDSEFTDIFYFFFNVTEDDTGVKWGSEKYITEVTLQYYEYYIKYYEYKKISSGSVLEWEVDNKVVYKNPDGSIYKITHFDHNEEPSLLDSSKLTEIYQTQKVTPEKITLQYIKDSDYNNWVAFAGGYYDSLKTTYLTLFNTNSSEAKEYLNASSEFNQSLIEGYNFGLVYGDKNGYSSRNEHNQSTNFLTATNVYNKKDCYAELVGFVDITYKENGETYYAKVSSTNVDNSDIRNPILGDNDMWQDEEGDPIPHPNNPNPWWWKIYQFFKNFVEKIKTFFSKIKIFLSSAKPIIIVAIIILLLIVLVPLFLKFINFVNTARLTREMKKYNKKE